MKVNEHNRTNPLSYTPGGVTVCVEYTNGSIREYDKVKYPGKFIEKIHTNNNNVKRAWVKTKQ
jgi:hypothetical protein